MNGIQLLIWRIAFLWTIIGTAWAAGVGRVVELTDANLDELTSQGPWVVEFYAPWCGACSRFTPEYEVLAEYVSNSQALNFNQNVDDDHKQFGLRLGKVDIDRNPVVTSRFLVSSLPTLFYIEDQSVRLIDSKRHAPTLLSYLESESWRSQAPVNAMLSPYSFHMRLLGFVGSFGHKMTTFANYLATEVSVWGLFASGATLITVLSIIAKITTPAEAPKGKATRPQSQPLKETKKRK